MMSGAFFSFSHSPLVPERAGSLWAGGAGGAGHGKDYYVADKKAGCLYPAQCLTVAASMFLESAAARAKQVLAEAKPYFKSKDEYLAAIDNLTMDKDAVIYNEAGTVTLDF